MIQAYHRISVLFAFILHLDLISNAIVYGIFTILASQLLTYAYGEQADRNVHTLVMRSHRYLIEPDTKPCSILNKRKDAVRAASKGKSDEEIQKSANAVANSEASFQAIFYNNACECAVATTQSR